MKVVLLKSIAHRLAKTKFGHRAMNRPDGLDFLKQKPTARVYSGLTLMLLSFLIGLPGLAFLSYLSVKMSKTIIIAVGGPVVFVSAHIIFGVGVYLAGQNYAIEALLWAIKRFLEKYA